MLHPDDETAVRRSFGVSPEQVRRDHLIAHLLAALSGLRECRLVFFGGTALSLTHLPNGRLSEDVDLLALPRPIATDWLAQRLPRLLRREYPGLVWDPSPQQVRSPAPATLRSPEGSTFRVQTLDLDWGWDRYPVEERTLVRRYRDVPATTLPVPTVRSFAVMKASAWGDRHAPRDLYDLAMLARLGVIDAEAQRIAKAALGRPVRSYDFTTTPRDWREQLAHQTADPGDPAEALAAVRVAWEAAFDARPCDASEAAG